MLCLKRQRTSLKRRHLLGSGDRIVYIAGESFSDDFLCPARQQVFIVSQIALTLTHRFPVTVEWGAAGICCGKSGTWGRRCVRARARVAIVTIIAARSSFSFAVVGVCVALAGTNVAIIVFVARKLP